MLASSIALAADGNVNDRPWWGAMELGGGSLAFRSDQIQPQRQAEFAMGFAGGHRLGSRARIGLELNGWLMQAFNLQDPAVGESVSNAFGIVDVFPVRRLPLFLRGGGGASFYTNYRPNEFNSHGVGGTIGLGFEQRIARHVSIAPIVQYSAGNLGKVDNIVQFATGRHYSVVEAKVGFQFHFGHANAR